MDEMRRLLNIMEDLAKRSIGPSPQTLAKRFRRDMEDMMGDDAVDWRDQAGLRELIHDWIDNYEIEVGDIDVDDLVDDMIEHLQLGIWAKKDDIRLAQIEKSKEDHLINMMRTGTDPLTLAGVAKELGLDAKEWHDFAKSHNLK